MVLSFRQHVGMARRSASPQAPGPPKPATSRRCAGWLDEDVDLVLSSLFTWEDRYRSASGVSRRLRKTVTDHLRRVLTVFLPLLEAGWMFPQLTLELPRGTWEAQRHLHALNENLARKALFQDSVGFAFRHHGRRREGPHIHLVLATPEGLNHDQAKNDVRALIRRIPGCETGPLLWPECTHLFLRLDGTKRFWPDLSFLDRRQALESFLLYLTAQYLLPQKTATPWGRRVDAFHRAPQASADAPADPLPFVIASRRQRALTRHVGQRLSPVSRVACPG